MPLQGTESTAGQTEESSPPKPHPDHVIIFIVQEQFFSLNLDDTIWPQVFRMLLRRIKRQISVSGCENVWWVDKTTWCQLFLLGGKWLGGGFAEQRTLP